MSDNPKVQVIVTKAKLVPKDLGNPRAATAKTDGDLSPHNLGILYGRATTVKEKKFMQRNPATGEVTEVTTDAILGTFGGVRAVPYDNGDGTETVEIRSSVLYLPAGITEMLTVPLSEAGTSIDFAFRLSTRKATSLAGYEYIIEQLHQPAGVENPLTTIRKQLGFDNPENPALPAQENQDKPALPAPTEKQENTEVEQTTTETGAPAHARHTRRTT